MKSDSNVRKDNRRLKKQLAIAQDELRTIKGSKAYSTIRIVKHAKNQLQQSPVKFFKKAASKVLDGSLRSKSAVIQSNLRSKDSLQAQYEAWIALNEPDEVELDKQKVISDSFKSKPLISIITPVFNPPVEVFVELIESVLDQTYPNFELCLGNFGDSEEIRDIIDHYSKKDPRIKALSFAENKGIAENSNRILSEAKGDYIALLDHDDTLSKDALFENVKLINDDDYDFIYSDKDKIDEAGKRFEPFFKPGWSPEIMLNANYLTHFNVMKRNIVTRVGGWDSSTDGAQDWDLFLKVVAESRKIGHIQKVLYHWRVIATSTALSIETKPYALAGQRNAVNSYLSKVGVPAKSYHVGAELLLDWQPPKLKTVCIILSNSNTHLRSFLASMDQHSDLDKDMEFTVLHKYKRDKSIINRELRAEYIHYSNGELLSVLTKVVKDNDNKFVLFYDDRLPFSLTKEDVRNLTGWLEVKGVVLSGPRIVDANGFVVDCGAAITREGVRPLFVNSPPYHQAPIGNVEWVRDLVLVSPIVFPIKSHDLSTSIKSLNESNINDDQVLLGIQLIATTNGRAVLNPKVIVKQDSKSYLDVAEKYDAINDFVIENRFADPYINSNLSDDNPMDIVDIVHSDEVDELSGVEYGYQLEANAHAVNRTLTSEMLQRNTDTIKQEGKRELKKIESALFILPDFYGIYAGLNNIFAYANNLHDRGVKISIGLMTQDKQFDRQRALIIEKYPDLGKTAQIHAVSNENIEELPHSDVAICTQWATAYILARYNKTYRKCYFIQDKESSFYPKGTISALVDNTYKFGFFGLANTPGLLEWYRNEYGGQGVVVKSIVDLSKYSPEKQLNITPQAPYKVFFYARPNEPRNAFELGVAALVKLKKSLGSNVEIFAAGADWSPEEYGLDEVMVNLGKINYNKLPSFYRSMDAGLMFMFSGHPGVVASELMASGCPVVVNEYDDVTWHDLYQHEQTCLVSMPTADEVARNIQRSLEDEKLRETIILGGLKKVEDFYSSYEDSVDMAYKALLDRIS